MFHWSTTACVLACAPLASADAPPLARVESISLPGVEGRIDHMALDAAGTHLFVAALGNGSLELVDLEKHERTKSTAGLKEPQGVVFAPAANLVIVACGGDGTVRAFDPDTLQEKARTAVGDDADNLRLAKDNAVAVGHGDGALSILDLPTLHIASTTKLSAHPESFQIDPTGSRAFVNTPGGLIGGGGSVEVVDLAAHAVTARWKLVQAGRNFPMALDAAGGRLFVGCRRPAALLVLDTQTGHTIAKAECVGDADDTFFDPRSNCVLVIGGDGAVDVFRAQDHAACTRVATIPTAPGARTGLFDPARSRLYVAAPRRSEHPAQIIVFSWTPPADLPPAARPAAAPPGSAPTGK